MKKQEFLDALREKISGLPKEDIEERINFYNEMICDRIEDGKKEENAIKELGSIEDIASQIISEMPIRKLVKNKVKSSRRLSPWEIVLLAVGSPIWLVLLISAFVVVLSVYISVWAVVISLWAIFVSFAACSPTFVVVVIITIFIGSPASGFVAIGGGIALGGLAILSYFGCLETTKAVIKLAKLIVLLIKKSLVRRKEPKNEK